MRVFPSGATRDDDDNKIDFEGILSPTVLEAFGWFMHKHSIQADGEKRASDNWQKGIPKNAYIKSALRHVMEWWTMHRADVAYTQKDFEETLCSVMFNVMGYLHETLKSLDPLVPRESGYIHTQKRDNLPK